MSKRNEDLLAQVPVFAGLSRRHVKRLADLFEEMRYMEGAPVVKEGQEGDSLYIILEGQARVERNGRAIRRLRPGDFFGEISLIDGGPRSASVIGDTPLRMLALKRSAFVKMVHKEPAVGEEILMELARRVRSVERPLVG